MKIDRLSWTGFGIVLIGWAVLAVEMVISDATFRAGNLAVVSSFRAEIITLAQTAILSGFGLAIVGTLRSGFGAFTRFFDAVLQRSVAPRPKDPMPLEPEPIVPQPDEPAVAAEPDPPRPPDILVPKAAIVEPERPRSPRRAGRDRNYVILSDGSVEVETMFGTRVFASMEEAKDFIR